MAVYKNVVGVNGDLMKDDICIHCRFYRKKVLKGRIISERCANRDYNDAVHFERCSGFSRSLKSILRLVKEEDLDE